MVLGVLRVLGILGVLGVLLRVLGCSLGLSPRSQPFRPCPCPSPAAGVPSPLSHPEGPEGSPGAGSEAGQDPQSPAAAPAPSPHGRDANERLWSVSDKYNVCSS